MMCATVLITVMFCADIEEGLSIACAARVRDVYLPNIIYSLEWDTPGSFEWITLQSAKFFATVSGCFMSMFVHSLICFI
jgi:hypothetical protein